MKTRGITRYGLVGVGLLLAGVMFFPGRAITEPLNLKRGPIPDEELKEIKKPRTKLIPGIRGYVRVPDGRGLGGVKIQLYEIIDRRQSFITETETNRMGFYSLRIGGERSLLLIPRYAHFRGGEHFSPREHRFSFSGVTARNFQYDGPLPDLCILVGSSYAGFRFRDGKCIYYFGVKNNFGVASGPFEVRVRVKDKGPDLTDSLESYKTKSVSSIDPGTHKTVEVELGPGTAEDGGPGSGFMGHISGSGRYEVQSIRVDIEDAVVESNEGNNHLSF
jgi:hypothetical protein